MTCLIKLKDLRSSKYFKLFRFLEFYLDEEDEADPLVEHVIVSGVGPGVGGPHTGMNVAGVVIKPHVLLLLGGGGPSLMENKLSFRTER